jgi:Winged helix-turn helix
MALKGQRSTPEERLWAVQLLKEGNEAAVVARMFDVSRAMLFRWQQKYDEGGPIALEMKRTPGPASRLSPTQLSKLYAIITGSPGRPGRLAPPRRPGVLDRAHRLRPARRPATLALGITSRSLRRGGPPEVIATARGHRDIEALHYIRDVATNEDAQRLRAGSSAQVMPAVRNTGVAVLRLVGFTSTTPGRRFAVRNLSRPIAALNLALQEDQSPGKQTLFPLDMDRRPRSAKSKGYRWPVLWTCTGKYAGIITTRFGVREQAAKPHK